MDKSKTSLYQSASKVWENVITSENISNTKNIELSFELNKKILDFSHIGKHYNMFFNFRQMEIEHVSPNVLNVLGYEPSEINALFFLDQIHPEDKPYFLSYETYTVEFFNSLALAKRGCYKSQHDYRIKTKNNGYIRLLHQILPIEFDESNYYVNLVLHTDITHIKKEGKPSFSIIGFDNEPSYYNIETTQNLTKSVDIFTKREKEILKYIVEGKNSKYIAKELSISLHTVNTHRKNILIKANCKNPIDLVAKVINENCL